MPLIYWLFYYLLAYNRPIHLSGWFLLFGQQYSFFVCSLISYSDPAVYFVGVDFIHAGVEGQGRFTEVVKQVALNLDGWGIDCTFADYNNGGFLDLYVCSYLDYGKVLSGADNFFPMISPIRITFFILTAVMTDSLMLQRISELVEVITWLWELPGPIRTMTEILWDIFFKINLMCIF